MFSLRPATLADVDFLTRADLEAGIELEDPPEAEAPDLAQHRRKIERFVLDDDKGAWVCEVEGESRPIGMLLCRFRNRWLEAPVALSNGAIFHELDPDLFPADGRFCEIFQMWVADAYRRRGVATALKRHLEAAVQARGMRLIYTHTRASHAHVIKLNRQLGYREVRRGPIWDHVVRVSLVKNL